MRICKGSASHGEILKVVCDQAHKIDARLPRIIIPLLRANVQVHKMGIRQGGVHHMVCNKHIQNSL